jgi:hypothetical protein
VVENPPTPLPSPTTTPVGPAHRNPGEGGPKFVSKNATTLTRASITDVLNDTPSPDPDLEPVRARRDSPSPSPEPKLKPETKIRSFDQTSTSPSLITLGIIVFSLIFGLSGWILYLNTRFNFLKPINLPQLSQTQPSETPAPTSPPEVTQPPVNPRAEITLEVLNGSGVKGVAGTIAGDLEKLGYTILNIDNADAQTYTQTEIYTAPSFVPSDLLLSDLAKDYPSATVTGELKDSTASAKIIIGKDWAN